MSKTVDVFTDVQAFMDKFGTPRQAFPSFADSEMMRFRFSFLDEELYETMDAYDDRDMVKFADGLGDLIYVAVGTGLICGLPMADIFKAIQDANMKKVLKSELGQKGRHPSDVGKPEGWVAADVEIAKILEALDPNTEARQMMAVDEEDGFLPPETHRCNARNHAGDVVPGPDLWERKRWVVRTREESTAAARQAETAYAAEHGGKASLSMSDDAGSWYSPAQVPRVCSFCGGLHPEDALGLMRMGWVPEGTAKEYKRYLSPPKSLQPWSMVPPAKIYFWDWSKEQMVLFNKLVLGDDA